MSAISSFTSIEKKHDLYRGKDCMKTLSESLREHAMKIILKRKKKWNYKQRAAEIKWKFKNILHLLGKIWK